ncbi:hypothetical protein QYE76_018328 [Lolium multiflorum]|uniref:CCHC-type domain-containing protein n=1 Tax=Lolium multiflorum TaxID=4521 RepID=A0AAD8Q4V3_LOLMU|nr:hypothetical protein QYE76_018328 [Lolium multiflorum]
MAPTSSYAYGLRCYKCKQQGHLPRECPNLLCEVCKAKGHVAWQCTTPSAKKLYFDELNAQVSKMPPLEDDLGGDGVEHGEHGILPSPTEAHGVEMVEHGKFPSTKEAHGDEQVEPTPICLIDELVPIPCEHESHLAHLSESDSELSDFHPICEFECFHLEDMSDTQSSTEDEFPLMEKMYMVHEDDDISPCLLQDGHVDHMDPPTSTTPTSHESAFKGTRTTTSTATEHELTKRAIESYPNKDEIHDPTHGIHTKGYKLHQGHEEEEDTPWFKDEESKVNGLEEEAKKKKEQGKEEKRREREAGASTQGWQVASAQPGRAQEGETGTAPLAGTTGECCWPVPPWARKKGDRYLWPEAPAVVPLGVPVPQYMKKTLPGTSGGASGQGTARMPNHTGCLDHVLVYFRYHGRYLRSRYRSPQFQSNLNR